MPIARAPLDPFGERRPPAFSEPVQAFGALFDLRSDSRELLALARQAYAGLPAQRLPGRARRCEVDLRLTDAGADFSRAAEPPPVQTQGVAGVLCGIVDGANFAVIQTQARRALVAISRQMLARHPYHARYELLEFALFTLACRALGLMPLHAACVGQRGRGLLLLGDSGAGKSTLALHAMLQGMELLTEDATFVQPDSLRATGVPNFVHLRPQALDTIGDAGIAQAARRATVIRRRSGVEKFELDLRQPGCRPATAAMRLAGVVIVSPAVAAPDETLPLPLSPSLLRRQLLASQPYARGMAGWADFADRLCRLPAWRLRRGSHPRDGAAALQALLHGDSTPSSLR
jgi:hypothetical protein